MDLPPRPTLAVQDPQQNMVVPSAAAAEVATVPSEAVPPVAVAELSPGSATVMESHSLQLSVQMEVRTDMEPRGLTVGALALPSALLLDRLSMMKNLPPRDTVLAALRRWILPDWATLVATLPPDLPPALLQFLLATAMALL